MEQENVNTVKYPASIDTKFAKVALTLGITKRDLFIRMVEYFYRNKKCHNNNCNKRFVYRTHGKSDLGEW